jgi:hypothetical protein
LKSLGITKDLQNFCVPSAIILLKAFKSQIDLDIYIEADLGTAVIQHLNKLVVDNDKLQYVFVSVIRLVGSAIWCDK